MPGYDPIATDTTIDMGKLGLLGDALAKFRRAFHRRYSPISFTISSIISRCNRVSLSIRCSVARAMKSG